MYILYLSRWLPYPANNGIKLRIYNLLRRLAEAGHKIHLITFFEQGENPHRAIEHLESFCSEVETVMYKPFQPNAKRARQAFLALQPRSVIATYSSEMAARVNMTLNSGKVEKVVACEIDMAIYGLLARKYRVPALLEELEVSTVYEQFSKARNSKERFRYGLTWLKYSNYIRHLMAHYQAVTVVSEQEYQILKPLTGKAPLKLIPNGADLQNYRFQPYNPVERANQLIFNGALAFNLNFQAMRFFLREIFPPLKTVDPKLKLVITGRYDGVNLLDLAGDSIPQGLSLTGYVEDIQPLMTKSAVCVVPLLQGGGTRLKVLEAFALGTPVVATSKGAEGLGAQNEEHLLVANTPQDFVQAILRLRNEPELAQRLTINARRLVENNFNWDEIGKELNNLLKSLN